MSGLAFIARGTAVADTDLVTVRPAISYGVPGCTCEFSIVGAPTSPSTAATLRVEVGDGGKETANIGVARR